MNKLQQISAAIKSIMPKKLTYEEKVSKLPPEDLFIELRALEQTLEFFIFTYAYSQIEEIGDKINIVKSYLFSLPEEEQKKWYALAIVKDMKNNVSWIISNANVSKLN